LGELNFLEVVTLLSWEGLETAVEQMIDMQDSCIVVELSAVVLG